MPHSHHSHSGQFCRHAQDGLETVVLEAIRLGFQTYGLSEHAPRWRIEDLFPEESDLRPSDLLKAFEEFTTLAAQLQTAYKAEITLLLGLETEWISPLDSSGLSRVLERHPEIQYVVGSVHHVHGISIDFDRPTWLRAVRAACRHEIGTTMTSSLSGPILAPPDVEKTYHPGKGELRPFLEAYFDAQYDLLRAHQPEVVGHLDLCLLWTPELDLREEEMRNTWERVERNIRYATSYGALFEANVAALRKGWRTTYPSTDILQLILDLGGRICLSDDSHGVSYVGLNYHRMRDHLVNMGVKGIWHLVPAAERKDGDVEVGTRGKVVARRMEGWAANPFWRKLADAHGSR